MEEKNNSLNTQNTNTQNSSGGCILAVIIILLIFAVYGCFSSSSKNSSHQSTCYWCGKEETCYLYDLQYVSGYTPDGSFKFKHKMEYMSSECAEKARKSGKYTNVTKTK